MSLNNKENYIVAEELFCIKNNGLKWDNSNYIPFVSKQENEKEPVFCIEFLPYSKMEIDFTKYKELGDFGEEGLSMFTYKNEDTGEYCLKIANNKKEVFSTLLMNKDFNDAKLYFPQENISSWFKDYSINNSLMIMYAMSSACKGNMLFHSSTIKLGDYGYMFLGKSGTGKSTHSKLWLKNIKDTILLNDDNPVVKVNNGEAIVYGSPWSGKTPCYKNEQVKVGGIVKLSQAPYNKIIKLSTLPAYAALLPTISCMKWEKSLADNLNNNIANLLKATSIYQMECLPDDDAAKICYNTIKK